MAEHQSWLDSRLQKIHARLKIRYSKQFEQIEQESRDRAARNEIAVFAHPVLRFALFFVAIGVFLAILQYTAPPRGIKTALMGREVTFVSPAELCFGKGCLEDPARLHGVKLPFFELKKFTEYQDHDLFYRLQVPAERKGDTLMLPLIWGDSEVYRSGTLVASGPNFRPIVPLLDGAQDIVVRVKNASGGKFGIRGIVSPFSISAPEARELEKELNGEPFQVHYSLVAQLAGFCLLLIMYLAFPYRPELFAFLVLFGVETLRSWFSKLRESGDVLISPATDSLVYSLLLVLGAAAVVFFVATFFRRPLTSILRFFLHSSWAIALGLWLGYVVLTSTFNSLSGENAFYIVLWLAALVSSVVLIRDTAIFLFRPSSLIRLAMGGVVLIGVGAWAFLNVRDHFVLATAITSEYQNHFHFFFFMATVLGVEVGRTEVKIREAFALLPKEVVRLIHDREESWRDGFVVALDVVDWSKRLRLLTEQETPAYMQKVNEYLLSAFDDAGASVVTGTGDGFFLTFESPQSPEMFRKLAEACSRLAQERPTLGSMGVTHSLLKDERIIVRSAMGYGRYYIGFVKVRNLKKEYLAGFLATSLARVMGNEKDPAGVRVLAGAGLDQFKPMTAVSGVQQTKGDQTDYWVYA